MAILTVASANTAIVLEVVCDLFVPYPSLSIITVVHPFDVI
jgi:hypothetical protein